MKKIFQILAVALAASLTLVSCNKDNKDDAGTDSGIIGTWSAAEDYHYPFVTFNKDGSYEWQWAGLIKIKDAGTYTYENGVVTMKLTKFWDYDEGWVSQSVPIDEAFNGVRTCKVDELVPGGCIYLQIENDYFAGGDYLMFKDGYVQDISKSDLVGTWEMDGSENGAGTRWVLASDGTITEYSWWKDGTTLVVVKYVGTWSINKNQLTTQFATKYSSYKSLGYNAETKRYEYEYYNVNPDTLEAEQWESETLSWDASAETVALANGVLCTLRGSYKKK